MHIQGNIQTIFKQYSSNIKAIFKHIQENQHIKYMKKLVRDRHEHVNSRFKNFGILKNLRNGNTIM